jgi:hypothetical protein
MRFSDKLTAIAVVAFSVVCGVANAQDINVVINGQPVQFTGTPPQELNGSVLVPLRGVFEQLGADVQYNPQTKTIFAQKDSTSVSLALGSSTAYVNNQPEQLAQAPAVIVGTTLVPLRFVAEAFGAYVEWQPQTKTVQIQTGPTEAAAIPPPPPAPPVPEQYQPEHHEVQTVSGRVTDVEPNATPVVVTLRTDSGPVTINVVAHTTFTVNGDQDPDWHGVYDIHRGDNVTAAIWPNGNAKSIDDDYTSYRGRIVALQNLPSGNTVVVLDNGHIIEVDARAESYQNHQPGQLDLHQGQHVSLRVHSGEHRAYSVDVY